MLLIGGIGATELAQQHGTPLYVYDAELIAKRAQAFKRAFSPASTLIAYSVKANGNLSVLRSLSSLGCGADVTSAGELHRALRAGIPPRRIIFAGVGKSEREIIMGIDAGIYSFNVESAGELARLESLASRTRDAKDGGSRRADRGSRETTRTCPTRVGFGIRVNPDVHATTPHDFTRTGRAADKFGVPWEEVAELFEWAKGRDAIRPLGLAMHIGSQIIESDPYLRALDRVLELARQIISAGTELAYVDIGGGFGISYEGEERFDIDALAAEVIPRVGELGLDLIVEPGRAVVGEAGILLTKVEYVKRSGSKTFVVVDVGMSELLRPSHYGGFHEIEVVDQEEYGDPHTAKTELPAGHLGAVNGDARETVDETMDVVANEGVGDSVDVAADAAVKETVGLVVDAAVEATVGDAVDVVGDEGEKEAVNEAACEAVDVVGPICESGDFLARNRVLGCVPAPGDLLAVRAVGAYGFTMASNYNGRLRPAEVMVQGAEARVVRRRETLDDLLRGEE